MDIYYIWFIVVHLRLNCTKTHSIFFSIRNLFDVLETLFWNISTFSWVRFNTTKIWLNFVHVKMWGLTSFHLLDKQKTVMFIKNKKFTYKPGVCLVLHLSNKGNLIGNMKLIEKIMSTLVEAFNFIIYPQGSRTKCFESTNHCIHDNNCKPSREIWVHWFQVLFKVCFQKWYVIEC